MKYLTGAMACLLMLTGCRQELPELELPVMRGHEEVSLRDDGRMIPLFIYGSGKIGLCLRVAPSQDTSLWRMSISFGGRPSPTGPVAPAARSGPTVCFDAEPPAGLPHDVEIDVCAELVDQFDGTRYRVPCQPARHLADGTDFRALLTVRNRLTRRAYAQELSTTDLLHQLDGVTQMAEEHGFALFGVQVTLIAVHFLTNEGTPEALEEAGKRLAELPDWLAESSACHQAALAHYQRGIFYLDAQNRVDDGWAELAKADEHFRHIADPKRFTVAMAQATILHQVGAVDEAITRLRDALEECQPRVQEQDRPLLEVGKSNLAWLILLNPDAGEDELNEAETFLRAGLERSAASEDRLELANRYLDVAYLEVRRGEDSRQMLRKAREVLATAQLGTQRGRQLSAWADLVEASAALARRDSQAALELCGQFDHDDVYLTAWAASCTAQAHRLAGRTEEAARAIDEALFLAYGTVPQVVDQQWTLGPSHRADDFARAARPGHRARTARTRLAAAPRPRPALGW